MVRKLDTIFFDLFGVLLGTDQSALIHFAACQLSLPYHQVREVFTGEISMELIRREISFEQYLKKIRNALPGGEKLNTDELARRWSARELAELPLTGHLPELSENYRIWVTTNTTNQHLKALARKFPFLSELDGRFTSQDAAVSKPNPRFFQAACLCAGSAPESVLFIDDNAGNVHSAGLLGITALYHRDYEETIHQMQELGVLSVRGVNHEH